MPGRDATCACLLRALAMGTSRLRAALSSNATEADDGDRTRDPQLGKLMLYQLSYVREADSV
jgi:hypothetical protein